MLQHFLSRYHHGATRISTAFISLFTLAGLILSIMYMLDICTEACSDAATYTIFGLNFSLFGVIFFIAAFILIAVRNRVPAAHLILLLLFFSAAGAELHFIWLQKYVIGKWCPICLAIASVVYSGCAVLTYETIRRGTMRNHLKHIIVKFAAIAIGISAAIFGVSKESQAAMDLFLGKKNSAVTVYFISDWFCPACRELEPRIEEIYHQVSKKTRIAFIDYPIHPETSNYTPYNLQFLAYEKAKYLKLRAVLTELAKKTKKPTPEQVQAAVSPLGVKLRQMDYSDILYGLQYNLTTYRGFGVDSTPSVVVANHKNKKQKILVGGNQITLSAVKAAISEVGK